MKAGLLTGELTTPGVKIPRRSERTAIPARQLHRSFLRVVVNMHKAEPGMVAFCPFEIVCEGPCEISLNGNAQIAEYKLPATASFSNLALIPVSITCSMIML